VGSDGLDTVLDGGWARLSSCWLALRFFAALQRKLTSDPCPPPQVLSQALKNGDQPTLAAVGAGRHSFEINCKCRLIDSTTTGSLVSLDYLYWVVTETVLVDGKVFAELDRAHRSVKRLMTWVDLSSLADEWAWI
jgi:hypothetical protein